MGYLVSKLPIAGFALAAFLGVACVNLFLENSKLSSLNSLLAKRAKELDTKNEELLKNGATLKNNLAACNASLASQNEAIKAAAVRIDNTPSKEGERIKKIYVKDKSCESELAAYKELFSDFADEDKGKK